MYEMRAERAPNARRRAIVALLALGVLAVGAAIGSARASADTRRSDDGVATAKSLLKQAEGPQKWRAPGPPFDAAKAAKGKLIEEVMLSMAIPFDVNMHTGLNQAVTAAGAKEFVFNANSDPSRFNISIQQGLLRKADLIFMRSILPSLVSTDLAKANAAGIKVGGGMWLDRGIQPGSPQWPKSWPKSVLFNANHCFVCAGQKMADFTIADSNGKANVLIIYPPDVPFIAKATVDGVTSEFKRLCKECKYQTVQEPVAHWKDLFTHIQSLLRRNPSVNYVIPVFDNMALFAVPGIHAAGAQNRVKVVTFNATPAVMKYVKNHDVVAADIGSAAYWEGWGQADSILRSLAGLKPGKDIFTPLRTFDWNNIDDIDLNAQESTWYDGTDGYVAKYKKLWGLTK